jgi:hypothetical protein
MEEDYPKSLVEFEHRFAMDWIRDKMALGESALPN